MTFKAFKEIYQKVPIIEYPNKVKKNALLTVKVLTYQHAPYLRACLDSILMQETSFDFNILIGEDDSSDGTRAICLEYAKTYPTKLD